MESLFFCFRQFNIKPFLAAGGKKQPKNWEKRQKRCFHKSFLVAGGKKPKNSKIPTAGKAFIKRAKGWIIIARDFFRPGEADSLSVKCEKGQIIIEYILLLVASTALALLLINLVSVEPGADSYFFNYWRHFLTVIGSDIYD